MMMTRTMMSKLVPGGRKMFSRNEATSSSVISGTPRMNSMKPTQIDLTKNMSERRPSASRMPSGSEKAMPVMPMTIDSMKPPNCLEATGVSDRNGSTSPSAPATGPAR